VEFSGRNYEGRGTGVILEAAIERASLLKDVDITIKPESESASDLKAPESRAASSQEETPEEREARKGRKWALKQQRRREAEALAQAKASGSTEGELARKKKRKETTESEAGDTHP